MKTQYCDECKHATMRNLPKPVLICAMLHNAVYWQNLCVHLYEIIEMLCLDAEAQMFTHSGIKESA